MTTSIEQTFDTRVDLPDFKTVVEVHVLGVLNQDLRTWNQLILDAAKGEVLIPQTKIAHMHPPSNHIPCMFCAAHVNDIHSVSAAIILSIADNRNIDDMWNSDMGRSRNGVVREAQKTIVDDAALMNMFGEHWGMVVSLGYRIEMANAPELVELLRKAVDHPEALIAPRIDGRDYTHTARWLVSSAMSGKRDITMSSRMRQRGYTDRLSTLAALVCRHGNPDAENSMDWVPVTRQTEAPINAQPSQPTLRVVR